MTLIQYVYERSAGEELVGALTQGITHAFMLNFALKLFRFIQIAPGLGFAYAPDRPKHSSGDEDDPDERYQIYITIKGWVNF